MDEEKLIREIWKKGTYRDKARPCPDEEIMASFTENLFGPERMKEVMGHIALYPELFISFRKNELSY